MPSKAGFLAKLMMVTIKGGFLASLMMVTIKGKVPRFARNDTVVRVREGNSQISRCARNPDGH